MVFWSVIHQNNCRWWFLVRQFTWFNMHNALGTDISKFWRECWKSDLNTLIFKRCRCWFFYQLYPCRTNAGSSLPSWLQSNRPGWLLSQTVELNKVQHCRPFIWAPESCLPYILKLPSTPNWGGRRAPKNEKSTLLNGDSGNRLTWHIKKAEPR